MMLLFKGVVSLALMAIGTITCIRNKVANFSETLASIEEQSPENFPQTKQLFTYL